MTTREFRRTVQAVTTKLAQHPDPHAVPLAQRGRELVASLDAVGPITSEERARLVCSVLGFCREGYEFLTSRQNPPV